MLPMTLAGDKDSPPVITAVEWRVVNWPAVDANVVNAISDKSDDNSSDF